MADNRVRRKFDKGEKRAPKRQLDKGTTVNTKRKRSIDLGRDSRNKRNISNKTKPASRNILLDEGVKPRVKRIIDKGIKTNKRSLTSNEIKDQMSMIQKDEAFYKECFDACTDHKCEECGAPLPDQFEYNGTIVARWRYSHIIPKSISKKLRHVILNINHLCFKCHQQWDFGNKKIMKIYEKNKKIWPQFLK